MPRRWELTLTLLEAWEYPYPTRYLRFAANLIRARQLHGVPGPFTGSDSFVNTR